MAFSRVDLVKRLINEPPNDSTASTNPLDSEDVFRRRLWNDLNSFDSMKEVHSKLDKIESEIWGKLIVMEQNFRTAKAYLRASTVTIDGTKSFFDGNRLGLSQFQNENRNSKTLNALKALGKGIRIKVDKVGNIWMKKNIENTVSICAQCAQYPEPVFLTNEYRKIVDLRNFRDSIIHELDITTTLDREKLFKKAIIFIKLTEATPEKNPLECALWLALIHLVSVDIITAIAKQNNTELTESSTKTSLNGPSPISTPSSSHCDNQNVMPCTRNPSLQRGRSFNGISNSSGHNTDSNAEDSSASTSSYVPSSSSYVTKQSSTKSNGGVARRIFNSQHPQRSHSVNRERASCNNFRQLPLNPRIPNYSFNPNSKMTSSAHYYSRLNNNMTSSITQPNEVDHNDNRFTTYRKRSQSQTPNGWSLLNLAEIDKLQKPYYFASTEDAERSRPRTKRGGIGHRFNSQSNLTSDSNYEANDFPLPINARQSGRPKLNIKWLSENSLRNLG